MAAVIIFVIVPTTIQLQSAAKVGFYGSLFKNIDAKDKKKLKAALFVLFSA